MRRVHGRRGAPDLFLDGISAVGEKLVGKEVGAGHTDVLDVQAEVLRALVGEGGLGRLAEKARKAVSRDEGDDAVASAEIFVGGPGFLASGEAAEEGVAFDSGGGGRLDAFDVRTEERRCGGFGVGRDGVQSGGADGYALQEVSSVHGVLGSLGFCIKDRGRWRAFSPLRHP